MSEEELKHALIAAIIGVAISLVTELAQIFIHYLQGLAPVTGGAAGAVTYVIRVFRAQYTG